MTDRRLREKNNKRGPRNRCGKKARKKKENKAGNKRIPVRNSPRCRCSFIFLSLSFFFVSVSNFVLPVFRYFFFLHLFCLLSFTVSVPSKTKRRERKGHVYINIFYFFLFLFHFFLLFVSSFRRFDGRRTRTDQSTGRGVGGSRWMLETGAYLKFFRLGVAGRNGNTAAVTAITTAAADSSLHGIPTIPALTPFFCFPWFLLCFLFSLFFFSSSVCVCVCLCASVCFCPVPNPLDRLFFFPDFPCLTRFWSLFWKWMDIHRSTICELWRKTISWTNSIWLKQGQRKFDMIISTRSCNLKNRFYGQIRSQSSPV